MKRKIHLGKLEKLVILVMVVTLAVSILPQLDYAQLFAEDPAAVTLELKEGNITRPLAVTTTDAKAVEAILLKDGAEIERKILNTNTPAQFDIVQNGTYVIQSIDVQGALLEEHEQTVEGLADIYVEKAEQGGLALYSRMENTDHIAVTFKEKKETVKVEKQTNGLYQGSYTPKENGSYIFQSEAADNTPLGTTATYEETGIAEQPKEEPKKEEPQEVKEIHITNEQGLKDIAKAPDKTYILDSDITVTSDSILVEKEFTGTLEGNGHVIKDLKQPLFTSLKKANIKDVNLSSTIDTDADTAALAVSAKDTKINGVGILAVIHSKRNAAGMLVNSTNTGIEHSYVSGEITGEAGASGFVVSGNANITNSYMTGIVEGKQSAYGFGKEADITNSYAAVYVEGKETGNFNGEGKKLETSFYDVSVASKEEPRAQEYTSAQMVSGNLAIKDFQQTAGSYPSLKKEITDRYSEEAKKLRALSTLAVSTETSLLGIEKDVALPTKTQQEEVTWKAEGNIGINGNTLLAKVSADPTKNTGGTLRAVTPSGTRSLKAASAKLLENSPVAGEPLAETSTHISFNMKERLYYKVTEANSAEKPTSHKDAITKGWKRYLWSDVINWSGLKWKTDYVLNEYNLATDTLTTYPITTDKGLVGGTVTLTKTYKVGTEITATLEGALCEKGSWTWEKSKSLSSGWKVIKENVNQDQKTSTYTPTTDDSGYFIRATFTVRDDQDYQGSKGKTSSTVIKEELTTIQIYTDSDCTKVAGAADMVVGKQLYAKLDQEKFDADVTYSWHHKTSEGADQDNRSEGNDSSYLITGKDVGKKIYVKATAKNDGGASGETKAYLDTEVKKAATAKPTVGPELVSKEDISLTVRMPSTVTKGLYQFGYKLVDGGTSIQPFDILTRGNNPVTITGLVADKQYRIYVKQIGEDGYEDSEWGDKSLSTETDYPHVSGTIEITASNNLTAYGQTLSAKILNENDGQQGVWNWYRIDADGNRSESLSKRNQYRISDKRDIGMRLEAVYSGDSTQFYAGEISAQSEIVKKAEVDAPTELMAENQIKPTDSTLTFMLPDQDPSSGALGVNERFIVGYSLRENGVPVEYRENGVVKEFKPLTEVVLKNLNRNTTYYLFLRYAEQDEHYKSDWTSASRRVIAKTEKSELTGTLSFVYANTGATNPIQGEKLVARLDSANTKEGSWTWTKIVGSERTNITNFFPEGEDATYYMIPATEAVGTTYEVTFTPSEGFEGNRQETTTPVQAYVKDQYDPPLVAPQGLSQTDTTLTFKMGDDADDGIVYEFQYGKVNNVNDTGNTLVDTKAYKGTEVTIRVPERNTDYYIWVRRAKDENKNESEWCNLNVKMHTEKTDILGYVSIEGSETAGKELTATYHTANYIPTGNDTQGTWKWYRENSGSYTQITSGITSNTTESKYTPTSADIGKKLKAEYTGSGDFQDKKEALTSGIKKNVAVDPEITSFAVGDEVDHHLSANVVLNTTENVWYRMQKDTEPAPSVPAGMSENVMLQAKWSKATNTTFQLTQDYENTYFNANTTYTLYVVKQETSESQASNIISKSIDFKTMNQSGTITLTGNEVIGKTITATLTGENNTQGTWKWYISTTDCGATGNTAAPDVDSGNWEQLASGYSPTIDSKTSTLTITEKMWKHYIKAEFVPNNDIGYGGESVKVVDSKFIKKIYNEEISIESSTKDGDGNPAAYSGSKITVNVKNWSKESLKNRLKIYINEQNRQDLTGTISDTDTNLSVTLTNMSAQDTKNVFAELTVPPNINLYVDENLQSIDSGKTVKSMGISYKYGNTISTAAELQAFILGTGAYTDRSNKYVLTNDINMSSQERITPTNLEFSGILDGDYHSISYAKNNLFEVINGTASKYAEVKNLIFMSGDIQIVGKGYSVAAIASQIKYYTKVNRVFALNTTLKGYDNTALISGFIGTDVNNDPKIDTVIITECGSAGGKISNTNGGSIGGLVGFASIGVIQDNFSVGTQFQTTNTYAGGFVGHGTRKGGDNIQRNYTTAFFDLTKFSSANLNKLFGPAVGPCADDGGTTTNVKYNFYDKTIINNSEVDALSTKYPYRGTAKSTEEMIGTGLQSSLGTSAWQYSDGYYPRLKWIAGNPISNLYAATRGSFISTDGKTDSDNRFKGQVYGAMKVPLEFQQSGYTFSSDHPDILDVSSSGDLIPLKVSDTEVTITVTYLEPKSGAAVSNPFKFKSMVSLKKFSDVKISGQSNPGKELTATAPGATSYKWYRRKAGSSNREVITGASSNKYTVKSSDAGYEISVEASANGYATMSSLYTDTVTFVPPTGIDTSDLTDQSVTVKAKGIEGAEYEYAYATSSTADKIIAGKSKGDFKISGLSRNTEYWLYSRVAGAADDSYEPSEWSAGVKIQTAKTAIVGPIKTNGVTNAGNILTASIADTNLQDGDWKIERVKNGTPATLTATTSTKYGLTYLLTDADAGSTIKITYSAKANTDFDKSVEVVTATILKRSQEAPAKGPSEIEAEKKDHSIQVQKTEAEADTKYEFGYRKTASEDIKLVSGGVEANTSVTINGLDRNTTYYVYARKAGKELYEPSPWSPAVQIKTDRTSVQANVVSVSGTPKVNQTLTFTAGSDANTKDQSGMWVLERIGDGKTNTLVPTTTAANTQSITYKLAPQDSGYQIQAKYMGTGDYKDSCSASSSTIQNDTQSIGSITPTIGTVDEYSIGASVETASSDIFEFGYMKDGDTEKKPYQVTTAWGKEVAITPLLRDTKYTIYVRKAAKTGYDASEWSSGTEVSTLASTLTGNITYTGSTGIGETLKVTYENGKYPYDGDDSGGSWQWKLDDVDVPAEDGGQSDSLTIKPVDGNPKVTVTYTAKKNSGFQGIATRDFGKVFKTDAAVPAAPTVTVEAEDNTREGSVLHLESSDVSESVYYYLRLSSNDNLPDLIAEKDVELNGDLRDSTGNVERWLKASESMDIRVPANKTYVVYAARLETQSKMASGINSARGQLSAKEPLLRSPETDGQIKESDPEVKWKTLQEKTLQYSLYGKAPTATWKYYVAKPPEDTPSWTPDSSTSWQNIDAELKALGRVDEIKDNVSYSTIKVPLKYTGYRLKAVLIGVDDYSGQVEYITSKNLEGKLLTSPSVITHSDSYALLDVLQAEYQVKEENDDPSGTFYWYRKKGDREPELVKKDAPGTTSSYQTQEADYQSYIYAVYVAAPTGQFSGESITDSVYIDQKATQTTPTAPEILQINGNSIQFKAPSNYNPSGMDKIPQVVVGYQKVDAEDQPIESEITWQKEEDYGDNWFKKLDRRSKYKLYAKYLGTSVYAPSEISAPSETITTENELFDEGSLTVQALSTYGTTDSDVGNKVTMMFSGDGYDEGYFRIRRSNGQTIQAKVDDPVMAESCVSYTYTYTPDDIGSYIIVDYVAKDDSKRFEGVISASNKLVITKPENPDTAIKPELVRDLDTNLYVDVKEAYEYVLNEDAAAPSADSGDWDTLDKDEKGRYQFTALDRTKPYYLHARIAETKEYRASSAVTSDPTTPTPSIDFNAMEVARTKDEKAAMTISEPLDFPHTLKKGSISIEDLKLTNTVTKETVELLETSVFTDGKGNAPKLVYEKGSRWANQNFAAELILYDEAGKIVDRTSGTKTTLDATNAATMKLAIYRANAVSDAGPYEWQMVLKDDSEKQITSLLKADVTMSTQIAVTVPQQLRMNMEGVTFHQSTNNASLKNDLGMPIVVGVDRLAKKGTAMPSLKGVMRGGIAQIKDGEAYMKMSNDGSNFTSPINGAWFHTDGSAMNENLFLLGRGARADYYVSGAASGSQNWEWDSDQEVKQAYGIRFVTSISEEDVGTYEKKVYEIREE